MARKLPIDRVAGAGAVATAALASMCCILPPVLGAIGLSGAVLSAFFEPLRPYFLGSSAALLATGFFFVFRKPPEAGACRTDASRISRASRPTFLVAAIATAALAMFPGISGLASGGPDTLAPGVASRVVVLEVDGMTCESCASGVREELLEVPGVIDAVVSYEKQVAQVRVRRERPPRLGGLLEAVERAGYSATLAF